jgi:hypothetical protein
LGVNIAERGHTKNKEASNEEEVLPANGINGLKTKLFDGQKK